MDRGSYLVDVCFGIRLGMGDEPSHGVIERALDCLDKLRPVLLLTLYEGRHMLLACLPVRINIVFGCFTGFRNGGSKVFLQDCYVTKNSAEHEII